MIPVNTSPNFDWGRELNSLLARGDLIRVQSHWPEVEHADTELAGEIYTAAYAVANFSKGEFSNRRTLYELAEVLNQHFDFQCYAVRRLIRLSFSMYPESFSIQVGRPVGIPITLKVSLEKSSLVIGVFAGTTFLVPILPPDYATKYTIERN